jgi:hypothetical protein
MNRKVTVPGVPLTVEEILSDVAKNTVVAIPHAGRVVLVFHGDGRKSSAWSMTPEEADKFSDDVREAHRAIRDDDKIAQLEKEFHRDDQ